MVRTLCSSLTSQTLSALQRQLLSVLAHGGRAWRLHVMSSEISLQNMQLELFGHVILTFIPRQNRQLQMISLLLYSIVFPLHAA